MGTLLYYSISVDPTMLTALGSIAAKQSKGTEKTYAGTLWLIVKPVQWVVVAPGKSRRLPPTVTRTRFTSALVGLTEATIQA